MGKDRPARRHRYAARMDDLADAVRAAGLAAGLDGVGVCSVEPWPEVQTDLAERKAAGLSGRLAFTYAQPDVSTDVAASWPWAERLVVGMRAYVPESGSPGAGRAATGRVARFAVEDAYGPLRAALAEVAAVLEAAGYRTDVVADDNRLVDRAAAVRAGLGWWGKNTMLLAPRVGPWVLIGSVITDAPLPVSEPMVRDCGTCDACIPACPTGALVAPGVLDARRCLAAWAQAPGVIPAEYRAAMGDRVYGCDDCLDACPPGGRLLETARDERGRVDLVELLAATDEDLLARFDHWYVPKRDAKYLRRNLVVALGNAGTAEHVPVIAGWLADRSSIVRSHAAWALGRIGGVEAQTALERALAAESVREVRAEIAAALEAAGTNAGSAAVGRD